ncbi:type II secretion system F family protein [Engelhardtia mirabilis]|uniref:Type II secretion system protein F n=1 Tax=Engelhardtia mirabilis TaxID=2528011 RepID=A0A518BP79_9BACT|nr:Type II secretion system protein F [Planctomycetes bacterium Pla133]QDV03104.1 Type II secretion system protein F [Planctomycetes bacterium Pla86]
MVNFQYAAKDASGKTVEGSIEARDRGEALGELRKQQLTPMRVDQDRGKPAKGKKDKAPSSNKGDDQAKQGGGFSLKSITEFRLGKVKPSASRQELVLFTRQLATMIGAGLSLLESLEVLEEQADTPPMKATCSRLTAELRGGQDLSAAMEYCPKAFSPLYISMVRAGEASGQMDIILERLADYTEASDELRREVKSAMTYPVISLVLVLGITAFLMLGVVPTFRQVFESLGTELPALTKFVLATSDWMRNHYLMGAAIIGSVVAGLVLFKRTDRGQLTFDHISLRLPVFGELTRKIALARFSRTFSTLIRSGVPIIGTLEIVAETAGNRVVADAVNKSREAVRNGNMLSEPLSEATVFPPMVTRMIAIGERSGALEQLLEKIAIFYDSQVKATIKSLTSLIEPLLISFMGVIVGGVVLSVFLPILDIVGQLGGPSG